MLELDSLDVYTNYSISVSAFTQAGQGKSSKQVFCRTAEDGLYCFQIDLLHVFFGKSHLDSSKAHFQGLFLEQKQKQSSAVCVFSVPSAPADVKAVTSGQDSLIVSWRSPALPNGIIQRYTVYRREVLNGQEIDERESSVLSGPNYLEISGLKSIMRYDIWVKAETSAGYGAASDITSVMLSSIGK